MTIDISFRLKSLYIDTISLNIVHSYILLILKYLLK